MANRGIQYIVSIKERWHWAIDLAAIAYGTMSRDVCIYVERESDRHIDKLYNVVTQYISGSSETVGVSTQLLLLTDPLRRHTT